MGKNKGPMVFVVVVAIIGFLTYLAFYGMSIGGKEIPKVADSVRLGMDLRGGLRATYQAAPLKKSKTVTQEALSKTKDIMRKRLDKNSYNDADVSLDQSKKRVIVEIPSVKNPDKLIEILGKPASLEFKGPKGQFVLDGSDVEEATAGINEKGENSVDLKFNSAGKTKFAVATKKYLGQKILIYVDGKLVNDPNVDDVITGGSASIAPMADAKEASRVATEISSGALPTKLSVVQSTVVDSILGKDVLNAAIYGGVISLVLILIFMVVFYRLPGLIADIALIFHTLIVIDVCGLLHITLTLPGIAGIVLGIGMAVDANVIIFERMKEELRWGKSLKVAVEAGFDRAWTAILDGNVSTLIAAAVLYFMGSGAIMGFAKTLAIDVIASMFTAITVTRLMLRSLMASKFFNNHKLFQ